MKKLPILLMLLALGGCLWAEDNATVGNNSTAVLPNIALPNETVNETMNNVGAMSVNMMQQDWTGMLGNAVASGINWVMGGHIVEAGLVTLFITLIFLGLFYSKLMGFIEAIKGLIGSLALIAAIYLVLRAIGIL